jgi:sulfur carrier protein
MQISVNGQTREVNATTLDLALEELGFTGGAIATAVNGGFVAAAARAAHPLAANDQLEVLAPMQGG